MDSPVKLLTFYGIKHVKFDQEMLDEFYLKAWGRAIEFFDNRNIKATFFVVGDEIESSETIRKITLQVHNAGHEIENHTYSHTLGLASLPIEKIREEMLRCNEIIEKITGVAPIGFRSPGYNVNSKVISIAKSLGFKYDSSGFWSIMNPVLKNFNMLLFKRGVKNADFGFVTNRLKQYPYSPSESDWLQHDSCSHFLELPFPRTNVFGLPFYNNFNLWAPTIYSDYISKNIKKPYMMYLFHLIEFMDLSDGIPSELAIHPNVKTSASIKIQKSGKLLSNLAQRYKHLSTRSFIDSIAKNKEVFE